MRKFSFVTISELVRELRMEGISQFNRVNFYRLVHKHRWPLPMRSDGHWRNFGPKDPERYPEIPSSAAYYKALVKQTYGIPVEIPPRPEGLIDYDSAVQLGLISDPSKASRT